MPAVTADQMREVDRIAVEDLGLSILQMMENAGCSLAGNVLEMLGAEGGEVAILAGSGGNGGGGGLDDEQRIAGRIAESSDRFTDGGACAQV